MTIQSLYQNLTKYKIESALIGTACISGIISLGIFISSNAPATQTSDLNEKPIIEQTKSVSSEKIFIDVSGAVNNPRVYELSSGSRISNALEKAGGLSDQADAEFVAHNLNLAQLLTDQQKIYIPSLGETAGSPYKPSLTPITDQTDSSGKVNLNTASASELDSLPGVGKATADKIITNRPYQSEDDLVTKKVLSQSALDKIMGLIEAP